MEPEHPIMKVHPESEFKPPESSLDLYKLHWKDRL
jgi:hypothetical protein